MPYTREESKEEEEKDIKHVHIGAEVKALTLLL